MALRLATLTILVLTFFNANAMAQAPADAIYHGGDVVTIDDKNPTCEAVAIKDGNIIAVGKKAEVLKLKGENTQLIDLGGKTLLPGFVDGHGHCFGTGLQAVSANLLAPPDHTITDIPGMVAELKKYARTENAKRFGIILGFGYDDAQLKEQRHPTRHDLDEVSRDLPVYIIHQSGHLGVGNSRSLELAGVTLDSKNLTGGAIRREQDGKTPNGVFEETNHFAVLMKVMPTIGAEEFDGLAQAGMKLYAANGYTTAQ
jgi:predicted amidohydrolase YtcJ